MIQLDLVGKAALVTGASGGLGSATAERLAEAGAAVILGAYQHMEKAESTAARIVAAGGRAIAVQADVRDPVAVQQMVNQGQQAFGQAVQIVVNNAGREERQSGPLDLAWSDYQQMVDLNLRAVYNTALVTVPGMRQAGWGRIVNVLTMAFLQPGRHFSAYAAGKGAMYGISRNMALELGPDGITVNMVAPGWIATERSANASPSAIAALVSSTPLRRQGQPLDVANAIAFFASPLAGFLTGVLLPISGGAGMH